MCLSALDVETGKVALSFLLERADKLRKYQCRECGADLLLRHGWIRTPHFAHRPESLCSLRAGGETQNHRDGKRGVIERLFAACARKGIAPTLVETEYRDPAVPRRADIAFFVEGERQIHEVQLSTAIPYEEIAQRTKDWEDHGYVVTWHFGRACIEAQHVLEWIKYRGQSGFVLDFQVVVEDVPSEDDAADVPGEVP